MNVAGNGPRVKARWNASRYSYGRRHGLREGSHVCVELSREDENLHPPTPIAFACGLVKDTDRRPGIRATLATAES